MKISDGDYELSEGKAWFGVKKFSIRIAETDEGVVCDIYEDEGSLSGCYAYDDECEEEPAC